MRLRKKIQGQEAETIELGDAPLTIGRSAQADIVLADERASRLHCGISNRDQAYYVKDLKSRNGTYLNDEKIEQEEIHPGDCIRIGGTSFIVEDDSAPGTSTVMHEVEEEIALGKGYGTIMREIVKDVKERPDASS